MVGNRWRKRAAVIGDAAFFGSAPWMFILSIFSPALPGPSAVALDPPLHWNGPTLGIAVSIQQVAFRHSAHESDKDRSPVESHKASEMDSKTRPQERQASITLEEGIESGLIISVA